MCYLKIVNKYTNLYTRETDRYGDRQIRRHTETDRDRQTERQTNRPWDKETDRETDKETDRERQGETERDWEGEIYAKYLRLSLTLTKWIFQKYRVKKHLEMQLKMCHYYLNK